MKIIATDIANLTDARYFAAWGVDGLAYNVDPLSENSLSPAELNRFPQVSDVRHLEENRFP